MTRARRGQDGGLAARLFLAQASVLVATVLSAVVVAALVGPSLFHGHLLEAGADPSSAELAHVEQAYLDASAVSLGVALVIALAGALAVTAVLVRRIRGPLRDLREAARDVSRGHYDVRVDASGAGYELDAVAGAFNAMASRLESVEDTRRRLLSDLAHELRTPLATLAAYAEGLDEGVTTWDAPTSRVVNEQLARITRLAEDLDDVSRAEEGRIVLERRSADAGDLVEAAVARHRDAYALAGVDLAADRPRGPLPVVVDEARLGQVLDNLLVNALRHTPAGGRVDVAARPLDGEAVVAVVDSGEGMSPEQVEHVFERFYRGDTARDRDSGGSGIGLTIARALVRAHGGSLTAASGGPGRGSTFTMTLPRGRDE